MDSPALLVAIAMLAAGAISTLGGLAVAGLQWQGDARGEVAEPVEFSADQPDQPNPIGERTLSSDQAPPGDADPPADEARIAGSSVSGPSGSGAAVSGGPVAGALVAGAGSGEAPADTAPVARPTAPTIRIPRPRPRTRRAADGNGAVAPSRQMRMGAYAVAAAERAARARQAAAAARTEAARAQFARDEAWRALEAVDALPMPVAPPAPAAVDPAITQAAFAAFRRGELTVDELRRVWGRPEDRDPQTAARDSERRKRLALSRAARRAYEQASANARLAEEKAQVAEVAAVALATEAEEAVRDLVEVTTP